MKFALGNCYITPGAQEFLAEAGLLPAFCLLVIFLATTAILTPMTSK